MDAAHPNAERQAPADVIAWGSGAEPTLAHALAAGYRPSVAMGWHFQPPERRRPWWPWVGALLAAAGLLLALQQVVGQAVRHGELRRQAAAAHDTSLWQCRALRDHLSRDACLTQLNSAALPATLEGR